MIDIIASDPAGMWSISYSIEMAGPIADIEGRAVLHGDPHSLPCLHFVIEVPAGEGFGYCKRFDQFTQTQVTFPAMPFDTWTSSYRQVEGTWCAPIPLESWQSLPRAFSFSVRRSEYGADDLSRLLADWAHPSEWDLDGDGIVGGSDLAILINNWKPIA